VYTPSNNYHVLGVTGQAGSAGGGLFQNTWSSSWGGWQNLGGNLTGTPSVTLHGDRFDVFAISPGRRLRHVPEDLR
jgi:hypothetical protein